MPLHIFLSTWIGTSFGVLDFAKIVKDVVLVIGALLIVIASVREPWFKTFLRDKLVWLIGGYAALTLCMALIKPTDADAEVLGIVYNIRFLLFFVYAWLLTYFYQVGWLRRTALKIVLGIATIVMLFGFVQYMWLPDNGLAHVGYSRESGVLPAFHIDDKPDLERVMSTLRDPNSFGSYIIIILAITLAYLMRTKDRDLKKALAGLAVLSGMCLLFTFSRSAWLGAVAMILTILVLRLKADGRLRFHPGWVIGLGLVLFVTIAGLYAARDTYFVRNVIFHADSSTVLEDPNQLRLRFWRESIESAAKNPLGNGPGTAGLASIRNEKQGVVLNENYYLQILHEVGIIGLALFATILVVVFLRLIRNYSDPLTAGLIASFIGLLLTNFLVHIWANEAVAYTWWGLAGLVIPMVAANKPAKRRI